jgi:hypothetical protein
MVIVIRANSCVLTGEQSPVPHISIPTTKPSTQKDDSLVCFLFVFGSSFYPDVFVMRMKRVEEAPGQAAQVNHITWESGTLSAPPHSLSNRQVSKEPVEAEQPVPLPAK